MNSIYESESFLTLNEGVLRPGGLALTREAAARAPLPQGAAILDVGCGTGASVALLSSLGYRARGIDSSAKLVNLGKSLGRAVKAGDAYALPGVYDALLYECSFSLLADKPRALSAAYGALGSGGLLLLSDLYPRAQGESPLTVPCLTCLNGILPFPTLQGLMEEAGFTLEGFFDKTDAYKGFLGMLIMEFGSAEAFFAQYMGPCAAESAVRNVKTQKLGYFLSIWRKP